jgi:nitroreductase
MDALTALKTRRSVKPKELGQGPGPSGEQLQTILEIATRVPDHGKLAPWKIIVIQGEGQTKLGKIAAEQFEKMHLEINDAQRVNEAARFTRAPLVLAVLSTPKESVKAPRWEQEMSAGAVCMNILHACHALGLGASWLSEWVAFDPAIRRALGGDIDSKIAGFIYVGEKVTTPDDRERPKLTDVVTEYK